MTNLDENTAVNELADLAAEWMAILQRVCSADWADLLPQLDLHHPDRRLAAHSLPVLSFLPQMEAQAQAQYKPLVKQLRRAGSGLHFNQTYSAEDFGAEFLLQYGWIKLLGPDAYWHSDDISSGLLLLGDRVTYPEHWHLAEELYFPLSGTADWYHQTHGWQSKSPGDTIYHASNIKHSMRTHGEPLLLLYVWRGGDLLQKSLIS